MESFEIRAPPNKPLHSIKDLTPKQPSPLLGVHLIEAVYGYCFNIVMSYMLFSHYFSTRVSVTMLWTAYSNEN